MFKIRQRNFFRSHWLILTRALPWKSWIARFYVIRQSVTSETIPPQNLSLRFALQYLFTTDWIGAEHATLKFTIGVINDNFFIIHSDSSNLFLILSAIAATIAAPLPLPSCAWMSLNWKIFRKLYNFVLL